jgi:hypothetical protein
MPGCVEVDEIAHNSHDSIAFIHETLRIFTFISFLFYAGNLLAVADPLHTAARFHDIFIAKFQM